METPGGCSSQAGHRSSGSGFGGWGSAMAGLLQGASRRPAPGRVGVPAPAGAFLALIVVAPDWRRFRPHYWFTAVALAIASLIFGMMLVDSFRYADRLRLRMLVLEESQPPLR